MVETVLSFVEKTAPVNLDLLENFVTKSMTAMEWTVAKIDIA